MDDFLNKTPLDLKTIGKLYMVLRKEMRATQEKEAPEMNMSFFESRFPSAAGFMLFMQKELK